MLALVPSSFQYLDQVSYVAWVIVIMLPHPPPTGLHRGLIRGFDVRFPPGAGNLTVESLMFPRGSIEVYTGFDILRGI